MTTISKGKLLAICVLWLIIFALVAVAWRWFITPRRQLADERREAERIERTGSQPHYRHRLQLALDSFSGYAILRSPEFRGCLMQKRIKLNLHDDGANYRQRIGALARGQVQMAAMTIDALIKVCAQRGEMPATIVAVIDETRGADAMVADKSVVPNVDALNRADMQFVLTPDSPSETLARVVMADFRLQNLPDNPFVAARDAQEVVAKYRSSRHGAPQAYVLWEPYVTQILENSNMHKVVDSSRFRGYIVDVLVANRDFLAKNKNVVREVLECYFRASYQYRDTMEELIVADAQQMQTPLTQAAAAALVKGIWWKNTQENFAHMGLGSREPLQHLEDIISNITQVLINTGAIETDPTGGQPNLLYYQVCLEELQARQFHPGLEEELIRDDLVRLPALADEQWKQLVEVGTLEVPALIFARGSARLTRRSELILDDLVGKLQTWPRYYVLIRGSAATLDDVQLAQERGVAAQRYLIGRGVGENRVRAVAAPRGATSVSFLLGQPPF